MGLIYRVTSPSGKVYIGQTTKTLKARRKKHVTDAFNVNVDGYDLKFKRAIRKYGKKLKWEILENDTPTQELDLKEQFYVSQYDSYKNGYNSSLGGRGNQLKTLSEDHKSKISCSMLGSKNHFYGKQHTDATKKKISKTKKDQYKIENHSFFGKQHTEETKLKISLSQKKRWKKIKGDSL